MAKIYPSDWRSVETIGAAQREIDFENFDEIAKRKLFVGATRARMHLTMIISEQAAAQLKETAGKRFTGGVVLYDCETMAGFGDGLWAVPLRTLWELE